MIIRVKNLDEMVADYSKEVPNPIGDFSKVEIIDSVINGVIGEITSKYFPIGDGSRFAMASKDADGTCPSNFKERTSQRVVCCVSLEGRDGGRLNFEISAELT